MSFNWADWSQGNGGGSYRDKGLTRLPPMRNRRFKIGAIDVETHGFTHKLKMVQVYHEDWDAPVHFPTTKLAFDFIMSLPRKLLKATVWYAHHAEFDVRYFMTTFATYRDEIVLIPKERMHNSFYEFEIASKHEKDGKQRPLTITKIRDSKAIFPFTLRKFTEGFAPSFVKKDIGLDGGVIFNPKDPIHVEYALNDVVSLVHAMRNFDAETHDKFGVHVKGTISSTAFQGWLRFAPEGQYYNRLGKGFEEFARRGYYGGLVLLNSKSGHVYPEVTTLDINSSYPSSMRLGVPKGKPVMTFVERTGFPGMYEIEAYVPGDMIMPIFGVRDGDNLAWPTGHIEKTVATSLEIDYMRKRGATVRINHGYYFPEGLCFPFNEFVDRCEELRRAHKGTPTEQVIKLMQNSVYGKFGTGTDGRECIVVFDDEEGPPEGYQEIIEEGTGAIIPNMYTRSAVREANYMLPHWAAWITANSRILINTYAGLAGFENVIYCDTDSLKIIGKLSPDIEAHIGAAYGMLKNEGDDDLVMIHAPKDYSGYDRKGELWLKAKGTPNEVKKELPAKDHPQYAAKLAKRVKFIEDHRAGKRIPSKWTSPTSFNTHQKTGKFEVERNRRQTDPLMIYGHKINSDGMFRPIHLPGEMRSLPNVQRHVRFDGGYPEAFGNAAVGRTVHNAMARVHERFRREANQD